MPGNAGPSTRIGSGLAIAKATTGAFPFPLRFAQGQNDTGRQIQGSFAFAQDDGEKLKQRQILAFGQNDGTRLQRATTEILPRSLRSGSE